MIRKSATCQPIFITPAGPYARIDHFRCSTFHRVFTENIVYDFAVDEYSPCDYCCLKVLSALMHFTQSTYGFSPVVFISFLIVNDIILIAHTAFAMLYWLNFTAFSIIFAFLSI